jgi:hypothetical protein
MKIKAVKIYQAVEFNRKLETYFVETTDRMVGLSLVVVEGIGVRVSTAQDSIIVPFTNVAYMKEDLSENDKKTLGRQPKVGEGQPFRSK